MARVVFRGLDVGITLVPSVDRVRHVRVERGIVLALQLPAAGNGDLGRLFPFLRVEVVLPLEAPVSVERLEPLRLRARLLALRDGKRCFCALARNHDRTGGEPVLLNHTRISPHLLCRRNPGNGEQSDSNCKTT